MSVVAIAYEQLLDPAADLRNDIQQAFGPGGLGLLTISGVPDLQQKREQLLRLAPVLAALPADSLAQLRDPASQFNFGWSCGEEQLSEGKPDDRKGSFYANPCLDNPAGGNTQLASQHPAYYRPNVWPTDSLPLLEPALKALGQSVVGVGLLLARHCDRFLQQQGVLAANQQQLLTSSCVHKARLLHYYSPVDEVHHCATQTTPPEQTPQGAATQKPAAQGAVAAEPEAQVVDHATSWCAWHKDHGSLTGLTCAMYMDSQGTVVPPPDPACGLYACTWGGQVVQARIPPDHVAFQVGEALQVHSGGRLQATPHYVRAAQGPAAAGVTRSTFAVFLQPNPDTPMEAPRGTEAEAVGVHQWQQGQTFGQFSTAKLNTYYSTMPAM